MTDKMQEFLGDVDREVRALREHASEEELGRLDLTTFDPRLSINCIYGQMTGTCISARAKELMDLCCVKIIDISGKHTTSCLTTRESLEDFINGPYEGQTWEGMESSFSGRDYQYFSALEGYIFLGDAHTSEIIAYLRGEADTFTL